MQPESTDHSRRIDELFSHASALPPAQRLSYLETECPDEEIREAVEDLLMNCGDDEQQLFTPRKAATPTLVPGVRSSGSLIGQVLGKYRITGLIGEGGMGAVYAAIREPSDIEQRVAIKVIRGGIDSPVAFERFRREGQILASLDHAGIARILDGDSTEEGLHYIVMEYIRGVPITEYCDAHDLDLAARIDLFVAVCSAVNHAHQKSVVHRDIKPGNILVTRDGVPKLVDFGIAKLLDVSPDTTQSAAPKTVTRVMTLDYASPEQVRGDKVTPATDVYALGVLLYELITGEPPYRVTAKTFSEIERVVCREDPARPSRSTTTVDWRLESALDDIVLKAMRKEPANRYATAGALADDLIAYRNAQPVLASKEARRYKLRRLLFRHRLAIGAAALIVLTAVGTAGFFLRKQPTLVIPAATPAAKTAPDRFEIHRATFGQGVAAFPSLTPDGKTLVYALRSTNNQWTIQSVKDGEPPRVLTPPGTGSELQPAVSPDGRRIVFRSSRDGGGLFVMNLDGSGVSRIAREGFNPCWSPDGLAIAYATDDILLPAFRRTVASELKILDLKTLASRKLPVKDGVQPSWSPGKKRIAYWDTQSGRRRIWTISADGQSDPVLVVQDGSLNWNPVWAPDGRYLYFASDRGGSMNFWRVPVSEDTGALNGTLESVVTPSNYSVHLTIAGTGQHMAFARWQDTLTLQKTTFDPATSTHGAPWAAVSDANKPEYPDISPDGKSIVYQDTIDQNEDLFISDLHDPTPRRLTSDVHRDRMPRWSPDGRRIAFYSNRSGRYELWLIDPATRALEQLTQTTGPSTLNAAWAPNSLDLAFNAIDRSPFLFRLGSKEQPKPLPSWDQGNFAAASWSPDGKAIAGFVAQKGIGIFRVKEAKYEMLTAAGEYPIWLPDSRRLLYARGSEIRLLEVATKRDTALFSVAPNQIGRQISVTRDGKLIVFTQVATTSEVWRMTRQP